MDPPFARAWWRERLVNRISERNGSESRRYLSNVVRQSQGYWENIIVMIVSRGSVFGSLVVQDAFVNGLATHFRTAPESPLKTQNNLRILLRRFSNIAAALELGALTFEELGVIVDRLLDELSQSLAVPED